MGKPASAGISNRNFPHRIEMPFNPPQADGVLKRLNKDQPLVVAILLHNLLLTQFIPRCTFRQGTCFFDSLM
jgi:hypothetical protein